jgi:LPS export ABC transporter protein LptC
MDKQPLFSRWRYWTRFHLPNLIYLLILLAIAAGSFWWIKRDANLAKKTAEKRPELVDAFAEGMTINRTNKDGSVGYVLTAKDVVHYGDKDGTVKTVTLVATPMGQPAMTAVANDGTWSDDTHVVQLSGDVKMTRAGSDEADEMILTTDAMQINLYDGMASTDLPFEVTQGKSEMNGKSFRYDYQLRNLTVGGQKDERIKATLYGREVKK